MTSRPKRKHTEPSACFVFLHLLIFAAFVMIIMSGSGVINFKPLKEVVAASSLLSTTYGGVRAYWHRAGWARMVYSEAFDADEIVDGLWVGNFHDAHNVDALEDNKIGSIVTVIRGVPPSYPHLFNYHIIDVSDVPSEHILPYMLDATDFIHKNIQKGVLIHCSQGRSRSVTVATAYLMSKHRLSLADALDKVRKKRTIGRPNDGFLEQLKTFENLLDVQSQHGAPGV